MLAYVRDVQRQEIRKNLASVKHQDLAGSNVGDDHKEYFLGEKALLAGGAANTMNQFETGIGHQPSRLVRKRRYR